MSIRAATIEQVIGVTGEIRAGGTDLQERRRSGIASGPIVDISRIAGLDKIIWNSDGSVTIGALVTIDAIASDEQIQRHYPGLALSAGGLATPQIRTRATLGGGLLQRNRCWYFRHPEFNCYKKGGDSCPSRTGEHQYGVVFDLGPCVYPHPSTLGMTLLTYEAQIEVQGQGRRPIAALFGDGSDPSRDHLLDEGELLAAVILPPPIANERAAYFRAITRAEAEWPLVEASVRLLVESETIRLARVAVGGVANIPLRLPEVEAALEGQPLSQATLEQAAATASKGTRPLPMTSYKVALLQNTVLETLERAAG
jgi:xanthine dehydrogenase YagS FAD-binding subunit